MKFLDGFERTNTWMIPRNASFTNCTANTALNTSPFRRFQCSKLLNHGFQLRKYFLTRFFGPVLPGFWKHVALNPLHNDISTALVDKRAKDLWNRNRGVLCYKFHRYTFLQMNEMSSFDNKLFGYWNTGPIALEKMSRGFQGNKSTDAANEGVFDS